MRHTLLFTVLIPPHTPLCSHTLCSHSHALTPQALAGFEKELRHLDGHTVRLARTDVTPPGFVLRVAGQGMPLKEAASEFGDLFVDFIVDFPQSVSAEQKKAFAKLLGK